MTVRRKGLLDDDDGPAQKATDVGFNAIKPNDETLQAPPKSARHPAMSVQAFQLTSLQDGSTRELTGGVGAVGVDSGNDLVLQDQTVSRFHCEVRLEDKRPMVRDLSSTNGTLVDGVRVKEGYLRSGSVLRLGRAEVRFELLDAQHFLGVSESSRFGELAGTSGPMRLAFRQLEKAARSDAGVLLLGEAGVGKSRAARALHQASARAAKPFLSLDCSAMPASVLESELFGERRAGVLEEAQGGTVLLDEVGELPPELQAKLVKVLEDRQLRRPGLSQPVKIEVRVVASTRRDLRPDVNSGRFRQDLYFRLAGARVTLPPLRQHPEDVGEIAAALLQRQGALPSNHGALYERAFVDSLAKATWPGNARELNEYLERCVLFQAPAPLTISESPQRENADYSGLSFSEGRRQALESFEKAYLGQLLARHPGKVAQAAAEADVDRVTLQALMRKHNLK